MTTVLSSVSNSPLRRKSFSFKTSVHWLGEKAGLLRADGKLEFRVSSPPEFRGEAAPWSPEHLFVSSVDICLMLTFNSLAAKEGLKITSYSSTAEGLLEWVKDGYEFTVLTLRPTISVEAEAETERVQMILTKAHHDCLIARSIRGNVIVEPIILSGQS